MTAKHTPGPWLWNCDRTGPNSWNEGTFCDVHADGGVLIASFDASFSEYPESLDEVRANVRLMAAAPELLEALKVARFAVALCGVKSELESLDAAIAKATGTTKETP